MLQPHDAVPAFDVFDHVRQGRVRYHGEVWQRNNLLLVSLPPESPATHIEQVVGETTPLSSHDAVVVVTTDHVAGAPRAGALVADRWGEIYYVKAASMVAEIQADDLGEWLAYVQRECPECQGEVR